MITKAFKINKESEKIFKSLIPNDWLVRDQNPDFHVDYVIEPPINNEPSGKYIAIQLKGIEKIKYRKEAIAYPLGAKHLRYYKKAEIPVFLVIVDITTKEMYLLFLQKYIKENINEQLLIRQKKITLKIPTKNIFSGIDDFSKEIFEALEYTKDLFPSSPEASLQHQIEKLKKMDPRFDIRAIYDNNKLNYQLKAKQNVKLNFLVKPPYSEDFEKKFNDALDKGVELKYDSSAVEITGSELISEMRKESNQGEISFHFIPERESTLKLYAIISPHKIIDNINGKITIGRKELRFIGSLGGDIIKITVNFIPGEVLNTIRTRFSILLNFDKWQNKSVSFLPFFNQIFDLFQDLNINSIMRFNINIDGYNIGKEDFILTTSELNIEPILKLVTMINKLKYIAKNKNIEIKLTYFKNFTEQIFRNVNIVYNILYSGEYQDDIEGVVTTGIVELSDDFTSDPEYIFPEITFTIEKFDIKILNQELNLGMIEIKYTNCIMVVADNPHSKLTIPKGQSIQVKFIGQKNSKFIMKNVSN